MGMAGKRQADPRRNARKYVRLVGEKHDRLLAADPRQRPGKIVDAAEPAVAEGMGKLVAEAGQPEIAARAAAL